MDCLPTFKTMETSKELGLYIPLPFPSICNNPSKVILITTIELVVNSALYYSVNKSISSCHLTHIWRPTVILPLEISLTHFGCGYIKHAQACSFVNP